MPVLLLEKVDFCLVQEVDSSAFVWHRGKRFSALTSWAEMVVILGGSAQGGSRRGQVPPIEGVDVVLRRLLEAG